MFKVQRNVLRMFYLSWLKESEKFSPPPISLLGDNVKMKTFLHMMSLYICSLTGDVRSQKKDLSR